ncbi:MAG: LPS export ABC transporter permease LptF [Syntrophobacterales bacterium]|jgi:lipopolysaccharide export system permease protein
MIIDRYLIGEISKPLIVICTILVVIFASYEAAQYLAAAAAGLLSGKTVVYLILLKVAIGLEVLLPTTLYFSVVVALGRMYTDSEITALSACGVSIARVVRAVFFVALPLAVLVASLSLYVRPWAYEKGYLLKAQAKAELDISRWKAGNFYRVRRMNRIIFAEEIDHENNRAERIFVHSDLGDRVQVIYAKQVYQHVDQKSGKQVLVFLDGYLYELSRLGDKGHIMKFEQSTMALEPPEIKPLEYKRRAASTMRLLRSEKARDVAELQWRLSTPLATILLALLGVPLSRTAPRQGKYARMGTAVLIYAVYYNTSAMAKKWVDQGVVGSVPGMWWVNILLASLILILLLQPNFVSRWRSR